MKVCGQVGIPVILREREFISVRSEIARAADHSGLDRKGKCFYTTARNTVRAGQAID
jgi:hypothetical protein